MKLANGTRIKRDGEGFVVVEGSEERPLTVEEEHLLAEELFALEQFKENTIIAHEMDNGGTVYFVDEEGFHPQALATWLANARRWHFDTDVIVLCRLEGDRPVPVKVLRF